MADKIESELDLKTKLDWHTINIKVNPDRFGTTVELDGIPVKGLKRVTVTHHAGDVPVVTLELFGVVELCGEATVEPR